MASRQEVRASAPASRVGTPGWGEQSGPETWPSSGGEGLEEALPKPRSENGGPRAKEGERGCQRP